MTWSREQYLADVLDPARRAGNVPPPDLYERYGLAPGLSGQPAFARQIEVVVAFWLELRTGRTYAPLVGRLLAEHDKLEKAGQLTPRSFAERHEEARRAQLSRLDRLARDQAGAVTHAGPGTVARLRGAVGGAAAGGPGQFGAAAGGPGQFGSVTDAEVVSALERAGVRIVESFPVLPDPPHPKQADLARYLQQLDVWPSAAVVFGDAAGAGFGVLGGFRLADGRALDEAAIDAAQGRVNALSYADPARIPQERILAILRSTAREQGELDRLLLSEVAERLRQLARSGLSQRVLAGQAHELGLNTDEAGLITAVIASAGEVGVVRQQVEDELAESRLRSAQRLAAGLPVDDPLRERVVALDAQVAGLIRQAGQELAQRRPEQAAVLLAEAASMARDDAELPERLAAVPPPAPPEATARVDGDHMLITWTPSPARAGQVWYRVLRGQDRTPGRPADGMAVVKRTEGGDVTDAVPPPGVRLWYSVFATRGGETWSAPAVAPPQVFTPEVTDVSVAVAETSVAVSWRPHPNLDGVLVVRRENDPPRGPDDGTAVEPTPTGFTDTGLSTGHEYYYRVIACYRPGDGQRRCSAGVVVRAIPEPALRAVTDLEISEPGDGEPAEPVMTATWTPPPYGQVRLMRGDELPPWPAGTQIASRPQDDAGLREIPGVPSRGADGRDSFALRLPLGRHFLLVLTVGRNASVAGNTAEVRVVEPVRGLSARRAHDSVRLGWIWPDGATDALIRWPGGERYCSRRVYRDEGGVEVTVGAAETSIEVRAIYPQRGGWLTAPGSHIHVPARGVAVTYRIRRARRWFHRARTTVELRAEQATRIPSLVVVRSTGPYAPDDATEGETVGRAGPWDITPGQRVAFPVEAVEAAKGPGWLACFVDPDAPEAQARSILLFPPPAEEMKLR